MIDRIDKLYARIINCQMIGKHLQASYVMFIHQQICLAFSLIQLTSRFSHSFLFDDDRIMYHTITKTVNVYVCSSVSTF